MSPACPVWRNSSPSYMDAVSTLEQCGIPREQLMAEKAELYRQLADINREIRQARKEISLCETIETKPAPDGT